MSEFIYINKLAWRFLRFKWNSMINKWVMLPTIKNTMEYSDKIKEQVAQGVAKYNRIREIEQSEGMTTGQARRELKRREKAAAKRSRVKNIFKKKGWVKK